MTASIALETEKILKKHDAVQRLEALQAAMAEEKKRRLEFYEWVTPDVKAEFIHGEIVIHSPAKKAHLEVTDLLSSMLSIYVRLKKIGRVATEKLMVALTRNDYEPDLVFFKKDRFDSFGAERVLFPAPDFVVEIISKSTAAKDRGIKKTDYAAHGVREYWIIDPVRQRIEQHILPEGATEYFPAKVFLNGEMIASVAIEGFEIPVAAVFEEAANLETIQKWLA